MQNEHFKKGQTKSLDEARAEAEKVKKSFSGQETINGIEIIVKWDDGHDEYVIYFPGIDPEVGRSQGIDKQENPITSDPGLAKLIFQLACRLARDKSNVYEIFKKVSEFAGDLVYAQDQG